MHNHAPIVLNCFSRGGSNILWNMFLSHPEACSPIRETLEIFRLDLRAPSLEGYLAVLYTSRLRFFDQWNFQPRRPIGKSPQRFIDRTLFEWKRKTYRDPEMRFKTESKRYALDEVEQSRLVIKNNNGLIFLSDILAEIYPQAVFIGLIRDPLALYESHKRRRTPVAKSLSAFVDYYRKMTHKMFADAAALPNAHIVRFEDLLMKPVEMMRQLYTWTGLDFCRIEKVRLKAKPHLHADGSHKTDFTQGEHYWLAWDEVRAFLEPNVNQYQVSLLTPAEIDRLKRETVSIREKLGY